MQMTEKVAILSEDASEASADVYLLPRTEIGLSNLRSRIHAVPFFNFHVHLSNFGFITIFIVFERFLTWCSVLLKFDIEI